MFVINSRFRSEVINYGGGNFVMARGLAPSGDTYLMQSPTLSIDS